MNGDIEFRQACEFADRGEHQRAFEAFERLAAAGHLAAQIRVADCYVRGLGTHTDLAAAIKWLEAAKESGSENAAELLTFAQQFERIDELQDQWRSTG